LTGPIVESLPIESNAALRGERIKYPEVFNKIAAAAVSLVGDDHPKEGGFASTVSR
jgi:hypothetical protein